jgi:uncharacterized protein YndB with AHSA1/START domain
MNEQDFTTTFTVDRTPEDVFAAITDVRGWWTGEIDGACEKLGDEFTYRYEDVHVSRQKVVEFAPGTRIVWLVLDARLSFTQDPAEWKGTRIVFDLSATPGGTEVRFTHAGLVPEFECFDACSNAWSSLVNANLRNLVTAAGRPA